MLTNPVSKLFVILAVLTAAFATLSFVDRDAPSSSWTDTAAYRIFRRGEWAVVEPTDRSSYHQSERTLVDSDAGLAIYHESERSRISTLVDMTTYYQSERTLLPSRDLSRFSKYQSSEWFGE
jgi:hypothetical protein